MLVPNQISQTFQNPCLPQIFVIESLCINLCMKEKKPNICFSFTSSFTKSTIHKRKLQFPLLYFNYFHILELQEEQENRKASRRCRGSFSSRGRKFISVSNSFLTWFSRLLDWTFDISPLAFSLSGIYKSSEIKLIFNSAFRKLLYNRTQSASYHLEIVLCKCVGCGREANE